LIRFTALRHAARLFVLSPFALVTTACSSDSSSGAANDSGAGGDAPSGIDTGSSVADAGTGTGNDATSANDTGAGGDSAPDAITSPVGVGPAPVLLGTAGQYVVLAMSAVTSVPTTAVTGDIGLSPAAASFITGFTLTKAGTKFTAPEVTGSLFAADNDPPTPINLTVAITNMQTAYTDAAGRPTPTMLDQGAGTIGGLTFPPGLYKWGSSVTIPADIMIAGAPNDTWIFQITGDLKMSSAKSMKLSGGAKAKNIVWQVAGLVDFGTTSHAEGVVLSQTAITLETGASINGRLLAQTAVTINAGTVVTPAP
jgi:hypothetical protein